MVMMENGAPGCVGQTSQSCEQSNRAARVSYTAAQMTTLVAEDAAVARQLSRAQKKGESKFELAGARVTRRGLADVCRPVSDNEERAGGRQQAVVGDL
ncbi:hypothetical protein PWT90_07642 [Aphanocladium album]|nr:hypothetical protein PWT90_07642 [Aphanocladium album]